MTAPKKPTGAPDWIAHSHVLSPDARAALIDALGFQADSQDPKLLICLQRVEHWLGFFPGGKKAIDNAPSAGVYRQELEAVKKSALSLLALLNNPDTGINPFTRDTLSTHFEHAVSVTGPDGIGKVTNAAGALLIACNSALKALEGERGHTQGRKKSGARDYVLTRLLELYGDYSTRPYDERERKGAVESLSDFERHELAFVRAAFRDINEDKFRDAAGDKKWLDLIRPIRQSSAKLRGRMAQGAEPRHRKKAKQSP